MSRRVARRSLGVAAVLALIMGAGVPHGAAATSSSAGANLLHTHATAPQPIRPKDAPFLIVAFGSSSTEGAGASKPAFTYPSRAEALFAKSFGSHPQVVVINRGIGGEDIDDMMKRLGPDVLARRPDLVIWQAGSNDILRNVPIDRFARQLRAGIAAMRLAGSDVILIEPQWCPTFAASAKSVRFVDAMRAIATSDHVALVRRYELMQQWVEKGLIRGGDLVGRDGLHMTDRAYELLAKAVVEQIRISSTRFRSKVADSTSWHL